jgi:hypothetical protein
MEIAIMTGFFTKRNVDIDAAHRVLLIKQLKNKKKPTIP